MKGEDLWKWRREAIVAAAAADVDIEEVDWLLAELFSLSKLDLRLELYRQREMPSSLEVADLAALWHDRLVNRTPVQYLAGRTPWRQFSLKVTPAVLIPRQETEAIVDLVADRTPDGLKSGNWVDLGTGSGAIAIGLASVMPLATIYAVDLSREALAVAAENAVACGCNHAEVSSACVAPRSGCDDRLHFLQGSWWQPFVDSGKKFAAMVSNPPYIPTTIVAELAPEVRDREPHLALDGGSDGLTAIRHLVAASPIYLVSGGIWLVEMMAGQGNAVRQLLLDNGNYCDIEIIPDLAGHDRFVWARRI